MPSTHDLAIVGGEVVKHFSSWERGEHEREWLVLTHLHRHVPDLVPAPLRARLTARPPSVTMTVVPGVPLDAELAGPQCDGLEAALRRLWSVPVGEVPRRRYHPAQAREEVVRDFSVQAGYGGVVGEAMAGAVAALPGLDLGELPDPVVGHGDPNLANYLWDGDRVRIVDFEDAGRSDIAYELAALVEHMSGRGTDWHPFLARFDVNPERVLAGRRLTAALWLRTLLLGGADRHPDPQEVIARQATRLLRLLASPHIAC